jgi:DNA-binding Xre family transcriptional regulator
MQVNLTAMMGRRQGQTRQRLTMVWLSEVTGISTNKLYDLENGKAKMVHLDQIDALCTILNCTVGQLLTEDPMDLSDLPLQLRQRRNTTQSTEDAAEALYSAI